jgi:hypothetical protein
MLGVGAHQVVPYPIRTQVSLVFSLVTQHLELHVLSRSIQVAHGWFE